MAELHALRVDRAGTRAALEATWEAGAAALVLPEDAGDTEVQRLLARFRPHALVGQEARGGTDRGPVRGAPSRTDPSGTASSRPASLRATRVPDGVPVAEDVALVVPTSGSTGAAKGVELSHAALHASVTASLRRLGARRGERWGLALPTHHIAGISVHLRAAALGTAAVVATDTDAVGHLDVEHVALVPAQLDRLLAGGADLARFATILLGGAPASAELLERARAQGARIVTSYGMTETVGGCVYDGRPLDDVEVAVDASTARIRVRGPVLLEGYRQVPAGGPAGGFGRGGVDPAGEGPPMVDAEGSAGEGPPVVDAEGWFTTPDLGCFDASGALEVLGRADAVLLSGGENVPLAAVASLLRTHPEVADVAVAAVADARWGEVPVALVVPADGARPPQLAALRAHVRARAHPAYAPAHLLVVDHLPRDDLGKLPRAEVVARLRSAGLEPA